MTMQNPGGNARVLRRRACNIALASRCVSEGCVIDAVAHTVGQITGNDFLEDANDSERASGLAGPRGFAVKLAICCRLLSRGFFVVVFAPNLRAFL